MAILADAMASERGFSLAPGLRDDARLEAHVAEAARCADPTRRNAHLARALLERAIDAQTERVFSLGTVGKDTLTVLTAIDFVGSDAEGEPGDEDSSTKSSKARHDETEKALAELEGVVGLDGVKDFVRSLRAQLLVEKERVAAGLPSGGGGVLHMVFAGNPGTGKTTVARIIANLLKALGVLRKGHLVEADRSSLVAGYSGQTALKTKAVVAEALGGVLFVDEAYALVSGDRDAFGKEALDTLMKEMEDHRSDLVVIAAGYNDEMRELLAANPGMESRFPTTLRFADYDARELMAIADAILKPQRLTLGEGAPRAARAPLRGGNRGKSRGAEGEQRARRAQPAGGGEARAGAAPGGDQTRQESGGPHHAHRRGLRGGVRRAAAEKERGGEEEGLLHVMRFPCVWVARVVRAYDARVGKREGWVLGTWGMNEDARSPRGS